MKKLSATELLSLSESLLSDGNDVKIRVHGSSMSPFIRSGTFVRITTVQYTALKIGDIVIFRDQPQRVLIHRIVSRKNNLYVTRGDALFVKDRPFNVDQLLGKIVIDSKLQMAQATLWRLLYPFTPAILWLFRQLRIQR